MIRNAESRQWILKQQRSTILFLCLLVPLLFSVLWFTLSRPSLEATKATWQEAFLNKVKNNERPVWMLEQIQRDLEPFVKTGISKKQLDQVMSRQTTLSRFEIKGREIFLNGSSIKNGDAIYKTLRTLAKLTPIPYVDFIISRNDSFYHVPTLTSCKGPLFSYTKRAIDEGIILFPNSEALRGYNTELKEVEKGNRTYPWHLKQSKAFWRGANSGFPPGSLSFMDMDNFQMFPRVNLVNLSFQSKDLLDARFNYLPHSSPEMNDHLHQLGYVNESIPISEHMKYKYQIYADGYTCPFHRAWQFFCNSVIFKQDSSDFEWFHNSLKPYEHYIPVNNDFNDLIEKIIWAQNHEKEVQQMIQNANHFAHTHLRREDIMLYVYLLLTEYSKLQLF